MKKLRPFLWLVVWIGISFQTAAQSALDLRINEILVFNESNYIDDFGEHSPWIEIFNSAYNPVDLGGLYITNDLNQPTKYRIPRGQQTTQLQPRSYLVLWANNQPSHGIRHLNFIVAPGDVVALFDANGRTLIDSVTIPFNMITDVTYGRIIDGGSKWENLSKSTPGANNDTEFHPMAAEKFQSIDPSGFGMAFVAMMVVFFALALLFVFFKNMSRLLALNLSKQKIARSLTMARLRRSVVDETAAPGAEEDLTVSGEVNAAIAMTLYLYASELHDAENTILTINKVSRTYSPWSSKIYGLRKFPN